MFSQQNKCLKLSDLLSISSIDSVKAFKRYKQKYTLASHFGPRGICMRSHRRASKDAAVNN